MAQARRHHREPKHLLGDGESASLLASAATLEAARGFRANLVLTSHGKRLPLVATSAGRPDVFSNSCRALLLLAAARGRFEPVAAVANRWNWSVLRLISRHLPQFARQRRGHDMFGVQLLISAVPSKSLLRRLRTVSDEEIRAFVDKWIVRDRPLAELPPNSPGLSSRDRREWWEFSLWMYEFLGDIIKPEAITREAAQHLSRLTWIFLRGTYLFSRRDPALRGEQVRFVELCFIGAGLLFQWIVEPEGLLGDADGLEIWEAIFGLSDPSPEQMLALLENWLRRGRNWEHAVSPIAWVRRVANNIRKKDRQGGSIPASDALYVPPETKWDSSEVSLTFDYREAERGVISLEQVGDIDAAAQLSLPHRTWMSVGELMAAVRDDEDLRQYIELRLQGFKPKAAWERLGWANNRGLAVDRRYRRLRQKVKASGFEHQSREIELNPGTSDANVTIVKERLRFAVDPASEGTLSGRVVYNPRVGGERFDRSR